MTIGPTRALTPGEIVECIRPYRKLIADTVEASDNLPTWDDGSVGDHAGEFLGQHPALVRVFIAAGTDSALEAVEQLDVHRRMEIFAHIVRLTRGAIGRRGIAIAVMDDLAPLSPWIARVRAES